MTLAPAHVAGAGMIRFGKYPVDVTLESMGVDAGRAALTDAGATLTTVDALYVGHVFGGPVAGQRIAAQLGLDGKPVSNHENYCASGATAVREAWVALAAGLHDVVLVIGVEKMTDRISGGVRPDPNDLDAAVGFVMAAGHAMSARRYMADHGATREQIADGGGEEPRALGAQPVRAVPEADQPRAGAVGAARSPSRWACWTAAPITDGAAAVVLCSPAGLRRLGDRRGRAEGARRRRWSAGRVRTGAGDLNAEDVSRRAGEQACELAGVGPDDIDFVEMHDCFTIAEIVRMEGLGLVPADEGGGVDRRRPHRSRRTATGQPERRAALAGPPGRRHRCRAGV